MLTELTISGAEAVVMHAVHWLKLIVEAVGAMVIGVGLLATIATWVRAMRARSKDVFSETRLTLGALPGSGSRTATWRRHSFYSRVTQLGSDRQTGRNRCHSHSA